MARHLSSKLAVGAPELSLAEQLGEGASASVFRASLPSGAPVALKVVRDPRQASLLADEAERLLMVGSSCLSSVLGAGIVGAGAAARLRAFEGCPYLVLELAEGRAIDPRSLGAADERLALAFAVARDGGRALADLHAAGTAHGDVKPSNLVATTDRMPRARLVDLGLGGDADAALPRGGTRRYLAPDALGSGEGSDGRARDLFALGITLAEIASEEVASAPDPSAVLARAHFSAGLRTIVAALTRAAPAARPSAAWVWRRALDLLGEEESPADRRARAERTIERCYLAVRRREVLAAAMHARADVDVEGAPGRWLRDALAVASSVARLRGAPIDGPPASLPELSARGRLRWLVALVGPNAASWPPPSLASDEALAERLLVLARESEPAAISRASLEDPSSVLVEPLDGPVDVALALGAGAATAPVLERAEQLVTRSQQPVSLVVALGRALRLRGEFGRALALLDAVDAPVARVELAETARRAGDPSAAEQRAREALEQPVSPKVRARGLATLARMALDQNDPVRAEALLRDAPAAASVEECRALLCLARGERDRALQAVALGLSAQPSDEERARLLAVQGGIEHASGRADAARDSFRRAVEHAVRAGAVLEEATYLTGLAAAAANVGALAEALDAAARAVLLFDHLGRDREAARAVLARAACFAQAGASEEALEAAEEAIVRARSAGDRRCRAYAHLAMADALPLGDRNGLEHARRAAGLLEGGGPEDELRASARLLARGEVVDLGLGDRLARERETALDARIEWWGARALSEASRDRPRRADVVLAELSSLGSANVPLGVRGPALAAGVRLAARFGESDVARRLAHGAREAARELGRRAPAELRASVAALSWAESVHAPFDVGVSVDQVEDVQALVHALGRRDRLRPLLDQVLDAMILWTGVERGLLLLRAPAGKLSPRAARNIARADLTGEQLLLSTSLAERALESREPVVAVDAAGELPDMYASVHALKLRSVLAVPLLAHGEALGVVYLDDRVRRGAFGPAELGWVKLIAALAAVAIADARDQLLLRRAARRARRAEARLAEELARKQAALDLAESELGRSRGGRGTRFTYDSIIGQSEPLLGLLRLVDRIAQSEVPVLIVGESGSGKELVARAIHDNGPRAGRPFVSENCAAIPETLLESALFGHVRGAFTGAARPRAGLFEVSDGGTLFLDEIGEMSLGMQAKLLRVLEGGEVHPVGSERGRRVDVRVIGATHRDLEALVKDGRFRQDLLYRLDVITVRVPPVRERRADIPILVKHFVSKHAGDRPIRVSKAALDALAAFDWPGNVRQLENEVRRALVLADDEVEVEHLSPDVRGRGAGVPRSGNELDLRWRVDLLEGELLRTALERTSGNQTRAAELLGLSRFGLQKMMRRLGIDQGSKPGRRSTTALGKRR